MNNLQNQLQSQQMLKPLLLLLFLLVSTGVSAKQKIVSAGGSLTEILYALNLGDEIIAVDSSSYFPQEVTQKPQVGYFRTLSAEGLLALHPTLIAAANGAGPDEVLQQVEGAGVKVKVFTREVYTIESWQKYIKEIGEYFHKQSEAVIIVERVVKNIEKMLIKSEKKDNTAIFLLSLGDRGPVAAGGETVPNMLFDIVGMKNIAKDFDSFKPFSSEELIKQKPDLIVMPSHVVKRMGGRDKICEMQVIKFASADNDCKIMVMDALLALGFGTRIDEAVKQLLDYES